MVDNFNSLTLLAGVLHSSQEGPLSKYWFNFFPFPFLHINPFSFVRFFPMILMTFKIKS